MVVAVLKLYFIGTALMFLAVLYVIVDSVGGLMYVQNQRYLLELHQENHQSFSRGTGQKWKHKTIYTVPQTCCDKAINE